MPYPSGRAAVKERMIALLEDGDELPEEDLIRCSTITPDLKKAGAVSNDLREAEQIVPARSRAAGVSATNSAGHGYRPVTGGCNGSSTPRRLYGAATIVGGPAPSVFSCPNPSWTKHRGAAGGQFCRSLRREGRGRPEHARERYPRRHIVVIRYLKGVYRVSLWRNRSTMHEIHKESLAPRKVM